ncbi:MAG: nickel pincer cofactor biosynthesis protein LarB [Spirochaetes bacterium]|nr:nickel pincer cofactor biosynthesis protein LarB [Spirochaetota bacterium]
MDKDDIIKILKDVKDNKLSLEKAVDLFKDLPFKNLDFIKFDYHRDLRANLGEVIYCKNKSHEQLEAIANELKNSTKKGILYSRAGRKKAEIILKIDNKLEYNKPARMLFKNKKQIINDSKILVLTGGTSDIPVAEEAKCTAEVMGNIVETQYDVGVAGIHRLFSIYDKIQYASVIIVIAGMEGALASVVSGLVKVPVIAVPTSVGYGANFKGLAPLLSMLNSCSPGVAVVNIDNGFGAGYLASTINRREK